MEDSKTVVAARELYNEQMVNALTPALIQHINTIEQEARQNSTPKTFLKAIQELCRQIPQWNQHVLDNEVKKILRQTEPGFLDDLLPAIFVSNAQILSSVSLHGNANKINLKIPKLAMFIHTVYIELARKLFKQVYLFCDKVSQTQKQMNKHLLEQLAKESVSLAVAKLLPVHDIIKACVLKDATTDAEESSQHGGEKADSHEEHNSLDNGSDQHTNAVANLEDPQHHPETSDKEETDAADSLPTSPDLSDATAVNEAPEPDENAAENNTDSQKQEPKEHDSEDLKPADIALPDDDSISDGEASQGDSNGSPRNDSTKGGANQSLEIAPVAESKDDEERNTEHVERPEIQEDSVDPNEKENENDDDHEQADKSTESPEEIVIDIGLSDDDCMRAKDDDGVLLSYDSDVNATRLQPTPTPFHPKQQAESDTKKSKSSQPEEDNNDDVLDIDKDDRDNSQAVRSDENAEDTQHHKPQPEQTTEPLETAEKHSAVKLSSFTADPDAIRYQNNDSTDLSDNDMDYNFTDDELFSDDDEVSRIIYDMKAKQMADDRDTVAEKLLTKESKVEPVPEPDSTPSSKANSPNSSMDVFLGDMAPKQIKKVLSTKSVELPIQPQNKTDRRANMTKRFEKRRAHQKVDPVIFDYNTDSDQDDQSSSPPFSNLPQQNKKNHNRKRVTLLPDAASDSE